MSAGKDREMIENIYRRAGIFTALLFLMCTACRKPAVFYEGGTQEVQEAETEQEDGQAEPSREAEAQICVYVCGEVQNPGVYELDAQARIADAVEAAGGMTEEADESWLNLAEHVADGQKIQVFSREEAQGLLEEQRQQESGSGLVNLNTASKEELMTLTGIGASKAEDIISYREQNGSFSNIEELMQIPGIKEGVFRKIEDQITV